MRASVRAIWLTFTEIFEGGIPYLYNDIRGMTTVAFGNLVNSTGAVVGLPFMHPGGVPATPAEIAAAWQAVHNDPQAAPRGHTYARKLTSIRLTREAMQTLALRRLDMNHASLLKRIPELDDMPACVQMGMHSVVWACGAASPFPRLDSAVNARDFAASAIHCHMNEWTKDPEGKRIKNAGLVPRNVATKILFRNADRVQAFHLDPDLIEWEKDLSVAEAPTLRAMDNPDSEPTPLPSLNTPITSADYPTIHVIPDTLDAWKRRDED